MRLLHVVTLNMSGGSIYKRLHFLIDRIYQTVRKENKRSPVSNKTQSNHTK